MFLSKGMLIKKHSKSSVIIQNYGGRYALKGKEARIWLRARDKFLIPRQEELGLILKLLESGLMLQADKPNEYGKYYVLANNCIYVNPRKKRLFSLRGIEKDVMLWLQGGARRLRIEELVYLIDNHINPLDYINDKYGVVLSERIYRSRIQVTNTLRREMAYAKSRENVVNSVLRLFGKNRLYLC